MNYIFLLFIFAIFQIIQTAEDYYKTLGIQRSASQLDIKKAFRKLSQKYHPDVNQDVDATDVFAKINNAYEVLSDPEKRKKYDKHGEEGLKEVGQQNPFNNFFDFFGGGGGNQGERKGPELIAKIQVTLEDIYNGKEVKIYLTKQVICPHCRGSGADNQDDVQTCPQCNGLGQTIKRQQIAPGFVQQFQTTCEKCGGKGKIFKSKCHICQGNKIIPGQEEINIYIEKGIQDNHKMTYHNAADDRIDVSASDLVIQVIQVPHPFFIREGNDLKIQIQLTLQEALLGFKKKIKHLDGRYIKIEKYDVSQPGEILKIKGEGMPQHEFSSQHGDLYVQYQITFPQSFTEEQNNLWRQLFDKK